MRLRLRGSIRVALFAGSLLATHIARGDTPPASDDARARADVEFEDGKKLMDAGKTAAACVAFAHSQELDPKPGRLLNLAYCHEAEGKIATAWREYNDGAALAEQKGQKERVEFAREHAAAVAKKLAFAHLVLPEGAQSVEVDHVALARELWSTPLPLDPGEHVFVVGAPGKRARTTSLVIGATAGVREVVIASLDDDAPAPAPASLPAPSSSPPFDPAPPPAPSTANRVPAIVATGFAAVGLGVGAVFGLRASSKKSDADAHCPGKVCDPAGSSLVSDARAAATVSTIGFGLAIVGAAAATWLFLDPPTKTSASARVTPLITTRVAGVGVEGSW